MDLIRVSDIFEVIYGSNLELNAQTIDPNGVNFVSRTSRNNGVSARIIPPINKTPIEAGVLTVAAGGSVLATFLQTEPFFSGRDLYFLRPLVELTFQQKLFSCMSIKANRYRYNYGRQANKTLSELYIPDPRRAPTWVDSVFTDVIDSWKTVLTDAGKNAE